jgi:hypothetical protein
MLAFKSFNQYPSLKIKCILIPPEITFCFLETATHKVPISIKIKYFRRPEQSLHFTGNYIEILPVGLFFSVESSMGVN